MPNAQSPKLAGSSYPKVPPNGARPSEAEMRGNLPRPGSLPSGMGLLAVKMAVLSVMASAAFSPTKFCQEQGLYRAPKEFQALLPLQSKRPDIWRVVSLELSAQNLDELGRSMHLFPECSRSIRPPSMVENPC